MHDTEKGIWMVNKYEHSRSKIQAEWRVPTHVGKPVLPFMFDQHLWQDGGDAPSTTFLNWVRKWEAFPDLGLTHFEMHACQTWGRKVICM